MPRGTRHEVHGAWCKGHGARGKGQGAGCKVQRCVVRGAKVHGAWCMMRSAWGMVHGGKGAWGMGPTWTRGGEQAKGGGRGEGKGQRVLAEGKEKGTDLTKCEELSLIE
jgi:hypothetical protein